MSTFELAIPTVLRREGGYVFDSSDPGGETNFGISKRSYPNVDIKNLTTAYASAIYKQDWWEKYGYGRILDQRIATKVFDTAVNMGATRAHKILQTAVNALGGSQTDVDGVMGPQTIYVTNSSPVPTLLHGMQDLQAMRYRELVSKNASLQKFLGGWLNRAFDRS